MNEKEAPKQPVTLTREELHQQVWQTPMSRLANDYGITGNGLAKICDRLNVPYPPRGYWAKKAAGKNVITYRLPKATESTPLNVTISPTSPTVREPELPIEVKEAVETARSSALEIKLPEKLTRPHEVIARWLAVFRTSNGAQMPSVSSSLLEDVHFSSTNDSDLITSSIVPNMIETAPLVALK